MSTKHSFSKYEILAFNGAICKKKKNTKLLCCMPETNKNTVNQLYLNLNILIEK